MKKDILIFAEQRDAKIQKITYELAGGAEKLAEKTGGRVTAVLIGPVPPKQLDRLAEAGVDEILYANENSLKEYSTAPYGSLLEKAVKKTQPGIILLGSTTIGMDLAPYAAVRLKSGLVTDCTGLCIEPQTALLLMTRPNADGITIDTLFSPKISPVMATVRPGVLSPRSIPDGKRKEPAFLRPLSLPFGENENGVEILDIIMGQKKSADITEARILVAGGRGVGGPGGFEPLKKLASLLGGEIACSRACVEAGWIDSAPQVGQTGKTVRPDLYLACGISGAFQHVTGMEGSKLIISINKNPAAPIFDISDLGIVGNVEVILPALTEALTARHKLP